MAKWFSGLEELRRYFAGAKLFKIGEQASNKVENAHIKQTAAQQELIVLSGFCNLVGQMLLLSLTAFLLQKMLLSLVLSCPFRTLQLMFQLVCSK
ncbi:hypothetical protein HMPREF9209_1001 [Lactobacillus gasseri 224-1]|uniref:ABC transmembrane type-1 domain-containing protein n=1 Tax=Lactobacillus gasseri 224-1 TaxID=679196 RepID=D1YJ95_LACGS|nr:hypothetical protein HMPREF9209_1001 [Lactobacillus gasseri 224-1]